MLRIYNTPKRRKEIFVPSGDKVKMYNCGLTVYDRAHIGNLRAYTMADIIRRSLEFLGYDVIQVQNFTDVGHETLTDEQKSKIEGRIDITDVDRGIDRLEKTAQKKGMDVWQVAEFYIKEALRDFGEMNFLEPHFRPRATQHVEEQIELIKKLLEKGYAYFTQSAIYYDISKFERYWDFTGQKPEEKKIAARIDLEIDPEKKNPYDFRLWQFNRPDHTMQWDFVWQGVNYRGYPGWHIECSAMAYKYLGNPIDIHTGGIDHLQIHHPNEIAQSEPIFGSPFVRYWYHNAFINVDGRRMGKSLGNAYNLDDIKAKGFHPLDLRYFYLTADFRKPQNFTFEALESAKRSRKKLNRTVSELASLVKPGFLSEVHYDVQKLSRQASLYVDEFRKSVEDSFNIPISLSILWNLTEDNSVNNEEKLILIKTFDQVLGLRLTEIDYQKDKNLDDSVVAKLKEIIEARKTAKSRRDYSLADQLRLDAEKLGFRLIDTKDGDTIFEQLDL